MDRLSNLKRNDTFQPEPESDQLDPEKTYIVIAKFPSILSAQVQEWDGNEPVGEIILVSYFTLVDRV